MQPDWNILAQIGAGLWLMLMSGPLMLLPALGVRLFDSLGRAVVAGLALALLLSVAGYIIGGFVASEEA